MVAQISQSGLMWLTAILVLVGNGVALIIPIFIHSPIIQNLIKPLTTSVFLMEGIFFLLPNNICFSESRLPNTGAALCILFIVVFAMLDNFLPDRNGGQAENDQQETPEDHKPEGGKPSLDNVGNMRYITIIYVVIAWVTYMMIGMEFFAGRKHWGKTDINPAFYFFFRFATVQYVFGMYIMNDAPPLWLYLVYMIPLAVLFPLASILAYYINDHPKTDIENCCRCFCTFMSGIFLYCGFRMMYQFQQFFKDEGDLKNKIIQGATLAVGYLWMCFIAGILTMGYNNGPYC
ncbi:hypothetical protein M9Y10_029183 [Tritrichomonas musculus]|uniref:Transmembrane protein n=1 Tax=Tritrichomonas musculus TaxID=1915356 RepID=A0ABR2KMA7_9EUKA